MNLNKWLFLKLWAVVVMLVIDDTRQEAVNIYRILHFLTTVVLTKLFGLWPQCFLCALAKCCLVHSRNDVEVSIDIPDRQNETHDSKTYGLSRYPYMANTDHIPRNSYTENTTCSESWKQRVDMTQSNVLHTRSRFEWRWPTVLQFKKIKTKPNHVCKKALYWWA